jgi:hypothetical protein
VNPPWRTHMTCWKGPLPALLGTSQLRQSTNRYDLRLDNIWYTRFVYIASFLCWNGQLCYSAVQISLLSVNLLHVIYNKKTAPVIASETKRRWWRGLGGTQSSTIPLSKHYHNTTITLSYHLQRYQNTNITLPQPFHNIHNAIITQP